MPRVLAISDLHGRLPDIPECDLLIIGGDICPDGKPRADRLHVGSYDKGEAEQAAWMETKFRDWLNAIPAKSVVGIAGNHDYVFETMPGVHRNLRWQYLQDSETLVEGLRVYGTPWCPNLPRWAFYGDDRRLQNVYSAVPADVDIFVTHGPPKGYGDAIPPESIFNNVGETINVGTVSATEAITRAHPRVTVCGHIHEARGRHEHFNGLPVYNVAYLDERYHPYTMRPGFGAVTFLPEFE